MNGHDLKIMIEATLLAAGRPVSTQQLLELFDERERPTKEQLLAALERLANDYADRGIELVEVASGWRIQVRPRCADVVSRLWQERPAKYSRALLETLALVAYRQPITRSEIEEIRGVSISSTIMRTLQERNWIRVVGHREVPGRPELLGTTREFLDYFGLKSLDQLPTLAELRDVETIGVQLELPGGEPAQAGEALDAVVPPTAEGTGAAPEPGLEADPGADENVDSAAPGADEGSAARCAAPVAGDEQDTRDVVDTANEEDVDAAAEAAGEDPQPSVDAEMDDEEDLKPTLVAADEATQRRFGEPPPEG